MAARRLHCNGPVNNTCGHLGRMAAANAYRTLFWRSSVLAYASIYMRVYTQNPSRLEVKYHEQHHSQQQSDNRRPSRTRHQRLLHVQHCRPSTYTSSSAHRG